MAKILDVNFQEKNIGQLVQDDYGDISFTYSSNWLDDKDAFAISCSLPLQSEIFKRNKCRAYFEGILPEDAKRKIIAKNLGISENNDFSMLEKIGGECAGALTFIPAGSILSAQNYKYRPVSDTELVEILKELPRKPLLAGERGIRLSLAGVQDKIAVFMGGDGKISIPLNSAPSTHILKPEHDVFDDLIFNEYFCLKLAKTIGLEVAEVEINTIENINYLLIERYDRIKKIEENKVTITRLHQEDFCQALGISSTKKYQREEGPSLRQCFELVREKSSIPVLDLEKLLDGVIFNFLIGNCDAHGKNFSLLYKGNIQLAPLYDLVCTLVYEDLDKTMAMKIGGEYEINKIRLSNFDKFSDEIGFSKPEVRKRILKLSDAILASLSVVNIPYHGQKKVADFIKARCEDFSAYIKQETVKK